MSKQMNTIALLRKTNKIIGMDYKDKIEKKYNSLVYNHIWLKYLLDYAGAFILSVLSAAIFAFGVIVFLKPTNVEIQLVSGGVSGLTQDIIMVLKASNILKVDENLIYSILYLVINIPLLVLAFKGVGKRFFVFTLVNVVFVSLFMNILKGPIVDNLALYFDENANVLGRAFFAGVCTGLSSAIAFKIDSSAGGLDILSYYIATRKSNSAASYTGLFNAFILIIYAVLIGFIQHSWMTPIGTIFFSIIYLITVMIIIDLINVRNKKAQVEIITDSKDLASKLIMYIPHGATLLNGRGVYTGKERIVLHMVVSINEVKKVVKIVKELDPDSFVNVTVLQQVYGRFHMKPIK